MHGTMIKIKKTILMSIQFKLTFIYHKIKYFRKVDKGRCRSIIAITRALLPFLRKGTMVACFLGVGKCCRDRSILICFGTGAKLLRNLL
jgi:hypothetical protein